VSLGGALRPLAEEVGERVGREVGFWRGELERPWREGRPERAARAGRWIGLGLALTATVAGLVAALRVERPWE